MLMPAKNRAGACECCADCCVTPKELAADITFGALPGITDMRIDETIQPPPTTGYSEDFESYAPGSSVTSAGWILWSGDPIIQTFQSSLQMGTSGTGGEVRKTFTEGGEFSYDYHAVGLSNEIVVNVNGVGVATHTDDSGTNTITLEDGDQVAFVFSGNGLGDWVDNLSIPASNPFQSCLIQSDGVLGSTQHSTDHWEHPETRIPGVPAWGLNLALSGQGMFQRYGTDSFGAALQKIQVVDDYYGTTDDCWYFDGSQTYLMQIEGLSGSFSLVKADGAVFPYQVMLEYYVYEDPIGDCILRIGAKVAWRTNQIGVVYHTRGNPDLVRSLLGPPGRIPGEGSFRFALTDPYQYSSYHPCAEDLGLLPLPSEPGKTYYANGATPESGFYGNVGEWQDGYSWEFLDTGLFGSVAGDQKPDKTLFTAGDLETVTDPVFSPWLPSVRFGWVWEINLTDDGITDLASLPETTLDSTNVIGTYQHNLKDDYTPIADVLTSNPSYFAQLLYYHDPLSQAITESYFRDAPEHDIQNSGTGAHVCHNTASDLDCGIGGPFVGSDHYWLSDTQRAEYGATVESSDLTVTWGDFSLVLKQPAP